MSSTATAPERESGYESQDKTLVEVKDNVLEFVKPQEKELSKSEYDNLSDWEKALVNLPSKDLQVDYDKLQALRAKQDELVMSWGNRIKDVLLNGGAELANFKAETTKVQEDIDFLAPRVKTAMAIWERENSNQMGGSGNALPSFKPKENPKQLFKENQKPTVADEEMRKAA